MFIATFKHTVISSNKITTKLLNLWAIIFTIFILKIHKKINSGKKFLTIIPKNIKLKNLNIYLKISI